MNIKIISEGLTYNTKVINATTGESIENITNIHWECDVNNKIARATIEFIKVPVEIVGKVYKSEFNAIEQIESIRVRNNRNWMNLLKLVMKHAPNETKAIIQDISDCDSKINESFRQLVNDIGGKK